MAFFKIGTSIKLQIEKEATIRPSVTPRVVQNITPSVTPNIKEIPQSVHTGRVVEPLDKENFIYFRARAISAGETSGPNGNGDYFPLEELLMAYASFIGRGLFLNHDAHDVTKSVGKIIDAYLITDPESNEIWVETLCKVDRKAHSQIARQIETGIIDSVSMGCNCEKCICNVCDQVMHTKEDFCEHIKTGLLKKFMKNGVETICYSINRGLTFSELSLVSMPADAKAKIHELVATNLKQTNSEEDVKMSNDKEVEKAAGQTDPKQPELKLKTTVDEQTKERALETSDAVRKAVESVKTTKEEQDDLKDVLQKLNALEYMQLQEYIEKRGKEMGSEGDTSKVQRFTDKEYEKGRGIADEKATMVKKSPVEEPALKETKKEIVERTAEQTVEAAKTETCPPEKATGEDELEKMKKEILRRFGSKLSTKLFQSALVKEVNSMTNDPKVAAALVNAVTSELSKEAQAKPGGKEYYYWTGASEPKSTKITTVDGGIYKSDKAGKDIEKIEPGTQTDTLEKQVAENRKEIKDEWARARESVKSTVEKQNDVMDTRKKMGFGTPHTAEYKKAEKLANSSWLVKNASGSPVLEATLGQIWEEQLNDNVDWAQSSRYGEILAARVDNDGIEEVAKILNTKPIEVKAVKVSKDSILKKLTALAVLLGIKEKTEEEKKEYDKLSFEEQLMDNLSHVESEVKKLTGEKKPEMKPALPKPPLPKDVKLEIKKEEPKFEPKKELPKLHTGEGEATTMDGGAKPPYADVPIEPAASLKASAFDKGDSILIGNGVQAKKDLESKMIVITGKDGKEVGRYPDAFGDDIASIIKLFGMVLGVEKKENAASEEKSEREMKLETELQEERTKTAIREKTLRCRALIEEMLEKGMIEPDEEAMKLSQREGKNVLDSRREGYKKSIDHQMSNFFKMDEIALESFAKSVKGIKKEASKGKDVLTNAPQFPSDPLRVESVDEWLRSLPWS